jgi:hypothetical protein
MDCYNCGELGHLAHQCPKPPKDKYKNKNKDKKDDYTSLKVNYDSLVVANELSVETHVATNQVVKIDIATSCDDLIDESIKQGSSSKRQESS